MIIRKISTYTCSNADRPYEVAFPEGDRYRCLFSTDDYGDNVEEPGSSGNGEWYVLDFRVTGIVAEGPNRDPGYGFISVLRKRMPSVVTCGDEVVYRT